MSSGFVFEQRVPHFGFLHWLLDNLSCRTQNVRTEEPVAHESRSTFSARLSDLHRPFSARARTNPKELEMHLRRTRIYVSLILLSGLLVINPAFALRSVLKNESFFDTKLDRQIKLLFEDLSDPSAVLRLYRMESLKFMADWDGRIERAHKRIVDAPEAPPLLKAHATWFLSRLDIKAGKLDEAEKKLDSLGFVTEWAVVGPFDNEGKIGFETAYPPETELKIDAEYEGKERPVRWREYPPIARFKYVNFRAIFVPDTDVAAYAVTFINSESVQDVAFRFGSDDAIKIWVDDALLYSDDGYHAASFDQAAAGVRLNAGWNKVLVKVTQGIGGWGFNFRITKPDGSPAEGLSSLADISEIPLLIIACRPREKIEPVEVYDFISVFKKIAAENPQDARAHANLGQILKKKHAFDEDDKEDLKAFEKAVELDKGEKSFYMSLAPLYPDRNKSRRAYEKVIEIDPDYAPAYYELGKHYSRSGFPKKAYSFFNKAVARDPSYFLAKIALAEHYRQYGWLDRSSAIMSELKWLYESTPYLKHYRIGFSSRILDDDELVRRCEDYLQFDYADAATRQTMISIFKKQGWMHEVFEQWEILYDINPASLARLIDMAKYYIDTMDFENAQPCIDKVLAIRPEDPGAHRLAGNINHWRDDNDNALVAWNKSLDIKPQNRDLREYIEYLKPKEKPFEDAYKVEVPELLREFNPSAQDYPDDTSIFLLDLSVYEVHPNGLYNKFGQQVVKILQKKGTEDFKYRYVTYSPGEDDLKIQSAKIYKLDDEGNITKVINAAGPFDQSLSSDASRLYYNVTAHIHFFNNLEVGDVIEYTYRKNQVAAKNLYGDYFGSMTYIQTSLPKKKMRVVFITPSEKEYYYQFVRSDAEPEITEEDGKRIYSWTIHDVPKIRSEDKMPGLAEVTPYIHISTFKDWQDVGDWYWGLIQDQFILNQDGKDVVAQLVEGLDTTLDKVRAIHNYVVKNTRYIGLEFGIHGHKPYKAYQVFDRKYGDCKDKATLIIAMLKEAGIDADIVILRTRKLGLIEPFPASLAVFNHAVCYIPELDLYLDGTAEYSGTGEFPWSDQGAPVLLVSKNKQQFTKTSVANPGANTSSDVYDVSVDIEGGVIIEGRRELEGQYNAYYRNSYQEEEMRKELLEKRWRASVPGSEVLDLEFSDLKDLEKDVWYSYKIKAPNYAMKGDDGALSFKSFFGGYDLTKNYANLSERKYDIMIDFPWTGVKNINYTLPEGYRVVETPEDSHQDTDFASCDITYEKFEGGIAVKMKSVMKGDRITDEEYQDFRRFCRLVDEKQNEKIRIAE